MGDPVVRDPLRGLPVRALWSYNGEWGAQYAARRACQKAGSEFELARILSTTVTRIYKRLRRLGISRWPRPTGRAAKRVQR